MKKKNKILISDVAFYSKYVGLEINGQVFKGDALVFLRNLQKDVANIIFLDPPFNLGKDYSNGKVNDLKPNDQYLLWLKEIIKESERVLNPGGALYIYHLPVIASQLTELLNEILQFCH